MNRQHARRAVISFLSARDVRNRRSHQIGHTRYRLAKRGSWTTVLLIQQGTSFARFQMRVFILIVETGRRLSVLAKTSFPAANPASAARTAHHAITAKLITISSTTISALVQAKERKDAVGAARPTSSVRDAKGAMPQKDARDVPEDTSSLDTSAGSHSGDARRKI